jgi:hypothetical protein
MPKLQFSDDEDWELTLPSILFNLHLISAEHTLIPLQLLPDIYERVKYEVNQDISVIPFGFT